MEKVPLGVNPTFEKSTHMFEFRNKLQKRTGNVY